jgi:hypothetical protein
MRAMAIQAVLVADARSSSVLKRPNGASTGVAFGTRMSARQ